MPNKAELLAGLIDANGDVLADNLDNVSVAFADVTSKPTTLAGYGITDAASDTELTNAVANSANWDTAFGWGNHASAGYATTTYVDGEVANLVASAPATLDTLNELAAALGDDPNFATTVSTSLGLKANSADVAALSGADFTGTVTADGLISSGDLTFNQEASSSPYPEQQIKWSNDSTTANGFYISQDSDRNGRVWHEQGLELLFGTGNTERMRIDSSGNVGIGTTDNLGKLTAQGTITAKASADQSTIALSHNGSQGIISVSYGSTGSYDPMSFKTSDAENMRLETDGDLHVDGDVIAFSTTISDARLKTNIQGIENAVSKVGQLNGYTFEYIADGKVSAGVIAQEVEQVLPEAVQEKELPLKADDGEQYKVVNYDALHGLLIEAVKELSARVEALEAK